MNATIIEQFNQLVKQIQAEYLNAQVENDVKEMTMHKYRLQSVKKALAVLLKLDFQITSEADVRGVPGIGVGTLKRIKEILETGKLSELKEKYSKKKQSTIQGIQDLTKVIGIGDKLAKKLVVDYHIKSVDDLKAKVKSGKIKLNDKLLLGLKYYGVVQGNIPRKEISMVEKYLRKEAHQIDPQLEIIICGSYRRGKKVSGDIDVLIYHPAVKKLTKDGPLYLKLFVKKLTEHGFLLDDITDKNWQDKYMGFCVYKIDNGKTGPVRRIDIRYIPYDSLHTATLYFTGPYELNTAMRQAAKKRNMILNEYGLYKVDKNGHKTPIKITSEADVFEYVGMDPLTPIEREAFSIGKVKIKT